jgi:peptidoglycan-associated lipoprotein
MNKVTTQNSLANSGPGGVAPVVTGPGRDSSDVGLIAGALLILALIVGAFWMYAERDARDAREGRDGRADLIQPAVAALPPPVVLPRPSQLHADIYYDFDRVRLDEDAKAILDERAVILKQEPDWALLIQGYADPSGADAYNKALGLRRAQAAQKYLFGLGVPETSIKVVSLGSEGAVCSDGSPECRRLNRRVHLQLIKVGAEHLAPPPPALAEPLIPPAGEEVPLATAPAASEMEVP